MCSFQISTPSWVDQACAAFFVPVPCGLGSSPRNALLTEAIANEEKVENATEDLLALEGMDKGLAAKLADGNVHSREDLAELAVDELTELTGIDEERAKVLIMKAREHWFA